MKKIVKWLFVILWMILLFLFSSESGMESTKTSQFFVTKAESILLHWFPNISLDIIVFLIRKAAHFFLYMILGILVSNATYDKKGKQISFMICLLYACTDELHQLFVDGRSGEFKDVCLDFVGSSIGIYLYYWFHRKKIED